MTFIPFGRNIEGVEAGSLAYFGHRPSQLEPHEIAIFDCRSPKSKPSISFSQKSRNIGTSSRDHIANLMWEKELVPNAKICRCKILRQNLYLSNFCHFREKIPHLAMFLRKKIKRTAKHLRWTKRHKKPPAVYFSPIKTNVKESKMVIVLLADKNSGEYRAMVGGFDFWDDHDGAEIPAFFVRRSSGSTLKPFLYAMGIDDGLMSPNQKVEDVPIEILGTNQEYDENFVGMISYSDALSQSLNIPFVLLLKDIGLPDAFERFQQNGMRSFVPEIPKMGLSAAVGIDLTPMELLQGYVALANKGKTKDCTIGKKKKYKSKKHLYLVLRLRG